MITRWSRFNVVAVSLWLASLAGLTCLLLEFRQRTIAKLGSERGQAAWEEWREEVAEQNESESLPVHRKTPKSTEPPALVLMRDRFPALLSGGLVTWSFFFGFCALVVRGLWPGKAGNRQP